MQPINQSMVRSNQFNMPFNQSINQSRDDSICSNQSNKRIVKQQKEVDLKFLEHPKFWRLRVIISWFRYLFEFESMILLQNPQRQHPCKRSRSTINQLLNWSINRSNKRAWDLTATQSINQSIARTNIQTREKDYENWKMSPKFRKMDASFYGLVVSLCIWYFHAIYIHDLHAWTPHEIFIQEQGIISANQSINQSIDQSIKHLTLK